MSLVGIKSPCEQSHKISAILDDLLYRNCDKKESEFLDHIRRCIHCSMQFIIETRHRFGSSSKNNCHVFLMISSLTSNIVIRRKWLKKRRFVNYIIRCNIKHLDAASLAADLIFIKPNKIKYLFSSTKSIIAMQKLCTICFHRLFNPLPSPTTCDTSSVIWLFEFVARVEKYQDSIRKVLSKKTLKHQKHGDALLGIITKIRNYIPYIKLHEHDAYDVVCWIKLMLFSHIKCGNVKCNKNYLQDKYGIYYRIDDTQERKMIACREWIKRKIINKWYICSGCKCAKYCSRKCQKISWNKQWHGDQCRKIQNNYKHYF